MLHLRHLIPPEPPRSWRVDLAVAMIFGAAATVLLLGLGVRGAVAWVIEFALFIGLCRVAIVIARTRIDRRRRQTQDLDFMVCPDCGYRLTGLPPIGNCPECGESYSPEMLRAAWSIKYGPESLVPDTPSTPSPPVPHTRPASPTPPPGASTN